MLRGSRRFWVAVAILGVLALLGVVGFVARLRGGYEDRAAWGYYAATFSFLVTVAQTAPLVSIALRFTGAHWRRPVARASELFAVVGLLNLLWFVPLLRLVPSAQGRRTIWLEFPLSPHLWDSLALVSVVFSGLALLYLAAVPDLAAARDSAAGWRRDLLGRLALWWQGDARQWRALRSGLVVLGAFYFIGTVFLHAVVASDFALSMVPGWTDSLFPVYHAVSGLQAGLAAVLVVLFLLRRFGGWERFIERDQFWNLAKILLALTLIWFYFWWSGFIIFWYGRRPEEQLLLQLLMTGPYRWAFFGAFAFTFVVPFFFLLLWNPIRRSVWGPALAGAFILAGTLLDRVRLFVASFSVEETGHVLETLPATRWPGAADVFIVAGGLGGAALLYLLATRLVSPVSLWEVREGEVLKTRRSYLRREVSVIGKL